LKGKKRKGCSSGRKTSWLTQGDDRTRGKEGKARGRKERLAEKRKWLTGKRGLARRSRILLGKRKPGRSEKGGGRS